MSEESVNLGAERRRLRRVLPPGHQPRGLGISRLMMAAFPLWFILGIVLAAAGWASIHFYRQHLRAEHAIEGSVTPWVCGEQLPGPALRIGFLGDSITWMGGVHGSAAQACAEDLSNRLHQPVLIIKCGMPASTSGQWLPSTPLFADALAGFRAAQVRFVCVQLSTNDAWQDVAGPQAHLEHLAAIAAALHAAGMTMVLNEPPCILGRPDADRRLAALIDADARLCATGGVRRGETSAPAYFRATPTKWAPTACTPTIAGWSRSGASGPPGSRR